jgi:hypothetical protein
LTQSTIDIPLGEDAVYRAVENDRYAIQTGIDTLTRGLRRLDKGLEQLDIGLEKLQILSSDSEEWVHSTQIIADAFKEQLRNPPEGWEIQSCNSDNLPLEGTDLN